MKNREEELLETLKLIRRMYKMNPAMTKIIDGVIAGDSSLTKELKASIPTPQELARLANNERI